MITWDAQTREEQRWLLYEQTSPVPSYSRAATNSWSGQATGLGPPRLGASGVPPHLLPHPLGTAPPISPSFCTFGWSLQPHLALSLLPRNKIKLPPSKELKTKILLLIRLVFQASIFFSSLRDWVTFGKLPNLSVHEFLRT